MNVEKIPPGVILAIEYLSHRIKPHTKLYFNEKSFVVANDPDEEVKEISFQSDALSELLERCLQSLKITIESKIFNWGDEIKEAMAVDIKMLEKLIEK